MDDRQPHRPNYAELNKAQQEALERQQQEAAPEPTRPDHIRMPGRTTDSGGMAAQQEEAIERHNRNNDQLNPDWKRGLKDRDFAQQMQQQREQEQAAQRQNEGPEHDHTGGRER